MVEVKAPGKLILIGEYVVLEGAAALVCAVDRFAKIHFSKNSAGYYISAPSIGVSELPFDLNAGQIEFTSHTTTDTIEKLNFFKSTFEHCWQSFPAKDLPLDPFSITIDTEAFFSQKHKTKLGFGSSASLTVALVKGIYKLAGKNPHEQANKEAIFLSALQAHKKAQQNMGSGIDVAASCFAGVLEYKVGNDKTGKPFIPLQLKLWKELPILIIFTGKSESTQKMVYGVSQLKERKPDIYAELMAELARTAQEGIQAYKNQNIFAFMNAAKTYYTQMNLLGKSSSMPIISEVHQKIARWVHQKAGAYKPSGAGGGDIGIAFAESKEHIENIRREIESNGFDCIDINIVEN